MTPKTLVRYALEIIVIYAVLHLLGLRDYTSVLTATEPTTGGAALLPAVGAAAYLLFYVLAWMLAPVLLLTTGLLALWNRLAPQRG